MGSSGTNCLLTWTFGKRPGLAALRGRLRLPVVGSQSVGRQSQLCENRNFFPACCRKRSLQVQLMRARERWTSADDQRPPSKSLVGCRRNGLDRNARLNLDQFHIKTQRLQFADQHVERLWHARLDGSFALDDGLVNLRTAIHVIGLRRQQLLEDVRCAIGFQRPHFHFAESLTTKLRLAAQRLLGNQRVRSNGSRVDLVVDQVRQLEHVDVANRHRLFEAFSGHAVIKERLARSRQPGTLQQRFDFKLFRSVEYRRSEVAALLHILCNLDQLVVVDAIEIRQERHAREELANRFAGLLHAIATLGHQFRKLLADFSSGPTQVRFQNLNDVHTRRHAERVQNDFHRRSVFEVRHILFRQNARDDTLVTVASGHLVTDGKLALHRDIDLDQLDDARRQFVALLQLFDLLADDLAQYIDLARGHLFDFVDLLVDARVLIVQLDAFQIARRDKFDRRAVENHVLGQQAFVGALVVQISLHSLAAQQSFQSLQPLVGKDSDFIRKVLFQPCNLHGLDGLSALVLFLALAREDLHVHHRAFNTRRARQRSVANITGLFAEDGAQQLFFRRKLSLALGRYLADQNVACLDAGSNADHAALVQIAQRALTHVGDVAGYFFRPQLRVARFNLKLLDVDGRVVIVLHHFFGDENCVLKVVTAPGHEGHQHIASQRQFAVVRARTVGNHLTLDHSVALFHDRTLIDTSVLVRALELCELIDVAAHFARKLHRMMFAFHAHNDAFRVHRVDDARAPCEDHRARVARSNAFHTGAHNRSLCAKQRNRLALHVRAHQCAVCVIVFEEGHQRRGHRNKLLRADVDVVHLGAADQDKIAGLTRVHQFGDNVAAFVQFGVCLCDHPLIFLPRGEVEGERLVVDNLLALGLQFGVRLDQVVLVEMVANLQSTVPGVEHGHVIEHAAIFHAAVRRLDEAVVVDPRIAAQRRNQSNVRTFRRFNRADTAVVRGVNVANFEARALTRQTTRSKSRKTTLVRDLRQRVGLIHELRQLRRTEEFADRCHYRLGVHQVVRHRRGHLLVHAHLLLDGAFHADEADTELVLHQLAHRAYATVAKVIDVVHRTDVLAQLQQVTDRCVEIVRLQRANLAIGCVFVVKQLDIELQPAHSREIVLAGIEEHAMEQRRRRIQRRRIAWTQFAVDFDQRFLRSFHGITAQRACNHRAHVVALREYLMDSANTGVNHFRQFVCRQLIVRFQQYFARVRVHHISCGECAFQVAQINFNLADLVRVKILQNAAGHLASRVANFFASPVLDRVRQLHSKQIRRTLCAWLKSPEQLLVFQRNAIDGVERAKNFFVRAQSERAQE